MTVSAILNADLRNREWIDQNFEALRELYDGQYIAVENRQVIAAARSIEELHETIEKAALFPSRDEVTIVYLTREPKGMLL